MENRNVLSFLYTGWHEQTPKNKAFQPNQNDHVLLKTLFRKSITRIRSELGIFGKKETPFWLVFGWMKPFNQLFNENDILSSLPQNSLNQLNKDYQAVN